MFGDKRHKEAYVFLSEMMFRKKFDSLIKMYGVRSKEQSLGFEKEIDQLREDIEKCAKHRNQYAHGSWLHASPIKGVSVKIKSKKDEVQKTYRKLDHKSMQSDLNLITAVRAHLGHFHKRFIKKR